MLAFKSLRSRCLCIPTLGLIAVYSTISVALGSGNAPQSLSLTPLDEKHSTTITAQVLATQLIELGIKSDFASFKKKCLEGQSLLLEALELRIPDPEDKNTKTTLLEASLYFESTEYIRHLVRIAKQDPHWKPKDSITLLNDAILTQNLSSVKLLVEQVPVDPNPDGLLGENSPIRRSILARSHPIFMYLIEKTSAGSWLKTKENLRILTHDAGYRGQAEILGYLNSIMKKNFNIKPEFKPSVQIEISQLAEALEKASSQNDFEQFSLLAFNNLGHTRKALLSDLSDLANGFSTLHFIARNGTLEQIIFLINNKMISSQDLVSLTQPPYQNILDDFINDSAGKNNPRHLEVLKYLLENTALGKHLTELEHFCLLLKRAFQVKSYPIINYLTMNIPKFFRLDTSQSNELSSAINTHSNLNFKQRLKDFGIRWKILVKNKDLEGIKQLIISEEHLSVVAFVFPVTTLGIAPGLNLFHYGAKHGSPEILDHIHQVSKVFLEQNQYWQNDYLFWAIQGQNYENIEHLLKTTAVDPAFSKDPGFMAPMQLAAKVSDKRALDLLFKHPRVQAYVKKKPELELLIHLAAQSKNKEALSYLNEFAFREHGIPLPDIELQIRTRSFLTELETNIKTTSAIKALIESNQELLALAFSLPIQYAPLPSGNYNLILPLVYASLHADREGFETLLAHAPLTEIRSQCSGFNLLHYLIYGQKLENLKVVFDAHNDHYDPFKGFKQSDRKENDVPSLFEYSAKNFPAAFMYLLQHPSQKLIVFQPEKRKILLDLATKFNISEALQFLNDYEKKASNPEDIELALSTIQEALGELKAPSPVATQLAEMIHREVVSRVNSNSLTQKDFGKLLKASNQALSYCPRESAYDLKLADSLFKIFEEGQTKLSDPCQNAAKQIYLKRALAKTMDTENLYPTPKLYSVLLKQTAIEHARSDRPEQTIKLRNELFEYFFASERSEADVIALEKLTGVRLREILGPASNWSSAQFTSLFSSFCDEICRKDQEAKQLKKQLMKEQGLRAERDSEVAQLRATIKALSGGKFFKSISPPLETNCSERVYSPSLSQQVRPISSRGAQESPNDNQNSPSTETPSSPVETAISIRSSVEKSISRLGRNQKLNQEDHRKLVRNVERLVNGLVSNDPNINSQFSNFGPLKGHEGFHHCHVLKKGRLRIVAMWKQNSDRTIELCKVQEHVNSNSEYTNWTNDCSSSRASTEAVDSSVFLSNLSLQYGSQSRSESALESADESSGEPIESDEEKNVTEAAL